MRQCPQCKGTVATEYCLLCGEQVWREDLKRWESGQIDLAAEGRRARRILDRMVARNPHIAHELRSPAVGGKGGPPPNAGDLVGAINAGFGRR